MSPPPVEVRPSLHAGLFYFVLSHLDLGRDAASLHRARPHAPTWAPALLAAYREAPGRLGVQFAPLRVGDLIGLFGWLERPPVGLQTPADRGLCALLYAAVEAEAAQFEASWASRRATDARCGEVARALDALGPLMTALWARREEPAPALVVRDAPALGRHGRGWPTPGRTAVAVSLAEPLEHVVCQVLHEAIHPVSDREVSAEATRDTRQGASGYSAHQALEDHAVAVGAEVVERHAPSLSPAYRRWREGVCGTEAP